MSIIQMRVIVISPFYNASHSIEDCLKSLMIQSYNNFEAYFIDDMSIDNSCAKFIRLVGDDDRFNLIVNYEKKFAIRNIYECLNDLKLNYDDIVIQLDGDDSLCDPYVIQYIVDVYRHLDCWVTHGTYINLSDGQIGACNGSIPIDILKNKKIRTYPWISSHLKTFKYGLFKKIEINDFKLNGEWLRTTHDLALMFPMIEMSGEKTKFIDRKLCIYNDLNELNDHKTNQNIVSEVEYYLRSIEPYENIETLY